MLTKTQKISIIYRLYSVLYGIQIRQVRKNFKCMQKGRSGIMAKQTILTPEGLKKLENELEYLKVTGRKEIAEKIKTARGFGDLSENSEYDAAKDAQAKMEERISALEAMLKDVVVLDADDVATDVVGICSKVKVLDMEFDDEDVYTIVGATEANPDENIISDESPIGQALIGRKEGEIVDIETPGGMIKFKILEISK